MPDSSLSYPHRAKALSWKARTQRSHRGVPTKVIGNRGPKRGRDRPSYWMPSVPTSSLS